MSHPRIQSPLVVNESPQYILVDKSPPPPLQPNTVGPVSPPPSARPRQAAYIERVHGIPHLIRPSRGGGSGGGHSSSVGAPAPVAIRPTRQAVVGQILLAGGRGPPFNILGAPLKSGGEAEFMHTCGCPRRVVHYETCIQSLMAQVQDLRSPKSRVAEIPAGAVSGSSLYRWHQSVLRGPDDPNLVYVG